MEHHQAPDDLIFIDTEYFSNQGKVTVTEFCAIHFHKAIPTRLLFANYPEGDVKKQESGVDFLHRKLKMNKSYLQCGLLKMNGLNFSQDIDKIMKFIGHHHVVGFNIGSEIHNFRNARELQGQFPGPELDIKNFYSLDLMLSSVFDHPYTLRKLCRKLSVDQTTSEHSAILDTVLTAECFFELAFRFKEKFIYKHGQIKNETYDDVTEKEVIPLENISEMKI